MIRNPRGQGLFELMIMVAALGIILGAGAKTVARQLSVGADLVAQRQAAALAEQVMEFRLASGKFPSPAELKTLAAGKFSISAVEADFAGTDLLKIAVTVDWSRAEKAQRQVRFVSLAGRE